MKHPPDKYLVVAEIDTTGFIMNYFNDFHEAEKYSEKVFMMSSHLSYNEMHKMEDILFPEALVSYKMKGRDCVYNLSAKSAISNGIYAVSILEINMDNFCLKSFIKERENYAWVFENISDEFLEKFPYADFVAN